MQLLRHYDRRLTPQPTRVVIRPFHVAMEPRDLQPRQTGRMRRIVNAVLALNEAECELELAAVNSDFGVRHWRTAKVQRVERDDRHALGRPGLSRRTRR